MSDIPAEIQREDLIRIINRDRFVKSELSNRVGALVKENLELMSIIQELQEDLSVVRQSEATLLATNTGNGDVTTPQEPVDVTS